MHLHSLRETLRKVPDWKRQPMTAYMDTGFKNSLPSTNDWLLKETDIRKCLEETDIRKWMIKEKNTLIHNDPSKRITPNDYKPIKCLLIVWKILTVQTMKEIYYSLISQRRFREEKKDTIREQELYIEQHIFKESRKRRKMPLWCGLTTKKAYDTVLQHWIIGRLKKYKISKKVIKFIEEAMKN